MKKMQPVPAKAMPTLADIVSLLQEEAFWNAHRAPEVPALQSTTGSLSSLAEAVKKRSAAHPSIAQLYRLILAVHQRDDKAVRLLSDLRFEIDVWKGEQQLGQAKDNTEKAKTYLKLGLLYFESPQGAWYPSQDIAYFTRAIRLKGHPADTALALRRRAERYLQQGNESSGLKDLQEACQLVPDNPRAWIEYGQALVLAGRHGEAERAANEALRIKPNEPSAQDLLQMARRGLPSRAPNISNASPALEHQARDKRHALYLQRLSSEEAEARRDAFRQLMEAFSRYLREPGTLSLADMMSQANFETLLATAPRYWAAEMPSQADKLKAYCGGLEEEAATRIKDLVKQSFGDCLLLYLLCQSFANRQRQTAFYQDISRMLASKGYYYQDISAKNTGHPIDAVDYGRLTLPYDSPDLLPLYQAGAIQILGEYHYSRLQSAGVTLQTINTEIAEGNIQKIYDFLQQFTALLNVGERHSQYKDLQVMQALEEKRRQYLSRPELLEIFTKVFHCHDSELQKLQTPDSQTIEAFLKRFDLLLEAWRVTLRYPDLEMTQALQEKCLRCFNRPDLAEAFKTTFQFTLKDYQTNPQLLETHCAPLLMRIDVWSQCAPPNAREALRAFNQHLDTKLSRDAFYAEAKKQTEPLFLRLEEGETPPPMPPKLRPNMTVLIEQARRRYRMVSNLNTRSAVEMQKRISAEAQAMLTTLLSGIENTLGVAPCAFSILGLGSYSRLEMSLCSDIDFAILVSDESYTHHPYFKSFLSMLVHVRRSLPDNVLTIESKDLQTLFGQEKSLMHTPAEMVLEHCPLYNNQPDLLSKKDRLTNTESYSVRRARLIFNSQTQSERSERLFEEYQRALTRQMRTLFGEAAIPYHQKIGELCFQEDFKKQDGVELIASNPSSAINLKKTHLRPLTLWIADAGVYFGIEAHHTGDILTALESWIDPLFLRELKDALEYVHGLRLKLHYAWVTQPRPEGLPFDAWLEMTEHGCSDSARAFYLDSAQRKRLAAIQTSLIEPMTATISVFSDAPPEVPFDSLLTYFERHFKPLTELDERALPEPHAKTLAILAGIAVQRPHLLEPSQVFRDLPPKIKLAYLDALEVALADRKPKRSQVEIETLERLLQTLWHYPTEDGFRAHSLRLERAWNQHLMSLVDSEVPEPTHNTMTLVQDNAIKYYALKPWIVAQLFTPTGEWQPKDDDIHGNHRVYRIMDERKTQTLCWAKVYPEQPGIEWLMLQLDQRLGVYGIPQSVLVTIRHREKNSAVLLSAHVPHPNLLKTLQTSPEKLADLDRAHFFKTLMRVLLTNPEDDKGDDYFVAEQPTGLQLIRIDNERAFFAPESEKGLWKVKTLQVKSILYCLDLLIEPIKADNPNLDAAIQDFLRLKPYALLKNLLLDLKALQPLWKKLFSEEDIKAHYENKEPWLSLPILYVPQSLAQELSVRMQSLQTLLALNRTTSGLKLLGAAQPTLAEHYRKGFEQPYHNNKNPYSQVLARFELSPGQHYKKQGKTTVSLHGTTAVTQSLRLTTALSLDIVESIWRGKTYHADEVLKEIERWETDSAKAIYSGLLHVEPEVQKKARAAWRQLPNRERVLLFNDFANWVRQSSHQEERAQAMLTALPGTTFHTLDLSGFHASLTDALLLPILKTGGGHLVELALNGCKKLSDSIPKMIADYCPHLRSLISCDMSWTTFARGEKPILLPSIERVEMRDCRALQYFMVQASPQADIILEGCKALKRVHLTPQPAIAVTQESGEFEYQLAKLYLSGIAVSRNAAQSCYWARLSRDRGYRLSELLLYALFNFYQITPTRIEEGEAAQKEAGLLVEPALFKSIEFFKESDTARLTIEDIYKKPRSYELLNVAFAGHLLNLDLNKAQMPEAALERIMTHCPLLADIRLESSSLSYIGHQNPNGLSPLLAPSLIRLTLTDLRKLSSVSLRAPKLKQLHIEHCDQLSTLATGSEVAQSLLQEGLVLYPQNQATATKCFDEALALEPNGIQTLVERGNALKESIERDYSNRILYAHPEPQSGIVRQFSIARVSYCKKINIPNPEQQVNEFWRQIAQMEPGKQGNLFLRLVAEGEQGKAEALLRRNPNLIHVSGEVTDLSKRTFRSITAFQYALWALDWHMWTMLLKYLPPEQAAAQAQQVETGSWVKEHGIHANWQTLIDAQKKYLDYYSQSKWSEAGTTWVKQVGGAQLLLPAHVINEYCHPSRPLSPCPDFTKPESNDVWRIRTTDEGEWFTAQYNGGGLGSGFGVCRGTGSGAYWRMDHGRYILNSGYAKADHQAVITLFSTRQKQRDELLRELTRAHVPRRAANA